MRADDAVYALALHWYGHEVCPARGEQLTILAASNIRLIARTLQVRVERSAPQLGFTFEGEPLWPLDAVRIAKSCVKRNACVDQVRHLCHAIAHLTVADLEGYLEASP